MLWGFQNGINNEHKEGTKVIRWDKNPNCFCCVLCEFLMQIILHEKVK